MSAPIAERVRSAGPDGGSTSTTRPAIRRSRGPRDHRRPRVGSPSHGAVRVVARPMGVAPPSSDGRPVIHAAALPATVRRVRVRAGTGAVRLTDRGVAVVFGTGAGLMLASLVTVVVTAMSVTG